MIRAFAVAIILGLVFAFLTGTPDLRWTWRGWALVIAGAVAFQLGRHLR